MIAFVTGATGFIGSRVAKRLRDRGDEVVCLVRNPQKAADMEALGCRIVEGDLSDQAKIRAAMEGAGAPIPQGYVRFGNFLHADGLGQGATLLEMPDPPTAVFAGSDETAVGVVEAARARGLRVPEDLSVVGFDDTQIARMSSPALTTVRQPLQEMGKVALRRQRMLDRVGEFHIARPRREPHRLEVEHAGAAQSALEHVLRQAEEGWSAIRGIEHRRHGLREGLEQLRRMHDPVPIAGHRSEGVVHRDARIPERLHLLEHRVRYTVHERVAREQEHGQAVRVRDARRGDHVQRAWSDRARGDHDLSPPLRLRERDRGHGHRLLVLAAPRRQLVAGGVQRRAEARHVAVPEDGEHARDERTLHTVDHGPLGDEVPDDRLGCC